MLRRRDVLRSLPALLGLGACGEDEPRRPFGEAPSGVTDAMLPADRRPDGILELFFFGGLNPWDTFYVVPEYGLPQEGVPGSGRMWWSFQTGPEHPTVPEFMARCGIQAPLIEPFATDGAGRTVHLGPFVRGLRLRPDLLARLRIVVTHHEQAPHQTAVPLMACGHRFGSPRMASTAAHVQRYFAERGPRATPYAYGLFPDLYDVDDFNGESIVATGLHPGVARPLGVRLGALAGFDQQAARARLLRDATAHDAAVDAAWGRLEARLRPEGHSEHVRARILSDAASARQALRAAPGLRSLFPAEVQSAHASERCAFTSAADQSSHGLDVAVRLLTDAQQPARWVTSLDGGLDRATAGMAYDTHALYVEEGGRNVIHALEQLAARINGPDERDPAKLDLDRHMILLTTEFGRSPHIQFDNGLDHWPEGFVTVLLGGPIRADDRAVVGTIDERGIATDGLSPAELRAALLLGQGIWPFAPEAFTGGDLDHGEDEIESARWLWRRVFGA